MNKNKFHAFKFNVRKKKKERKSCNNKLYAINTLLAKHNWMNEMDISLII